MGKKNSKQRKPRVQRFIASASADAAVAAIAAVEESSAAGWYQTEFMDERVQLLNVKNTSDSQCQRKSCQSKVQFVVGRLGLAIINMLTKFEV